MEQKKAGRIWLDEETARNKILEGTTFSYNGVAATFGPRGRNIPVVKPFGNFMLTRDGVTVAKELYLSDPAANVGTQALREAAETTNRKAGDGTTQTVLLAHHLYRLGVQAITAGQHPMELKEQILADSAILQKRLKELVKPTKPSQLKQVATVSSGDPLLGELIAGAVEYVGPDGGIIAEKAMVATVEREFADGYYIQSGFEALQSGRKELTDPHVVVVKRRLTSHGDAMKLLEKTAELSGLKQGQVLQAVFIGNIEEAAYHTITQLMAQGVVDGAIIKPPLSYGAMAGELLEDIAIYAGCEPIIETTNLRDLNADYLGTVERIVANKNDATLFGNQSETVEDRIAALKERIKAEQVDAINERLRDRLAKLEGKIALFRIGGATNTAKEETEFRVEDAILATRAAYAHGVVPGGGVTLLELSRANVSELTRSALREVFKQLLINANLPEQLALDKILKAKYGLGFNLRAKDNELVDMVGAGILDPALVVEEVIRNACEISANLITSGGMIVPELKAE